MCAIWGTLVVTRPQPKEILATGRKTLDRDDRDTTTPPDERLEGSTVTEWKNEPATPHPEHDPVTTHIINFIGKVPRRATPKKSAETYDKAWKDIL